MTKPLRKKGFWRAFRRHALVAVVPYSAYQTVSAKNMFTAVYPDCNCGEGDLYIMFPLDWT